MALTIAGPHATQQKSQVHQECTNLLGLSGLCGGERFKEIMKVEPVEFIRIKQIEIWLCGSLALRRNDGTFWHTEKQLFCL